MKVCIYDNPATMAREAWQDGGMIGHTQAKLLLSAEFHGYSTWPFIFNVGPWEQGMVYGDETAMLSNTTSSTRKEE